MVQISFQAVEVIDIVIGALEISKVLIVPLGTYGLNLIAEVVGIVYPVVPAIRFGSFGLLTESSKIVTVKLSDFQRHFSTK